MVNMFIGLGIAAGWFAVSAGVTALVLWFRG